ncbi:substrate-binding periplasmic protein [Reinekea sp.]|jgi:polar amino acid transport system substrate-binding protein|uniref:substrate-binding periplasmic protein n=1 Tax=Reinekea sp. TaxID=1970455 RepID=UPI002A7F7879|nr:transporter substrate-binding domain-containing protein [Reinekea sp.]
MKLLTTCILTLLFGTLFITSNRLHAETYKMASGDWAPFTHSSERKSQLFEHLVSAAFALENVTVSYEYFPWKRCLYNVEHGQFHATFPWFKTTAREEIFNFTATPLYVDNTVFFHLAETPFDWTVIEDLKKYQVGVTTGFERVDSYKALGIPAQEVPEEYLNFEKLLAGRIDVYETSEAVGYAILNDRFSDEDAARFTHHPKAREKSEYYMMFSKSAQNAQSAMADFERGIQKLQASGRYDEIVNQFLGR